MERAGFEHSRPTAAERKVKPKSAGPDNARGEARGEAQSNLPSLPPALLEVFRGGGTSLADNQDKATESPKLGL